MAETSLEVGEIPINDDRDPSELLFRQITPHIWVAEDGIPASHAFGPMTIDQGKPSYSRGSRVNPEDSFDWHNNNASSRSYGVWACSVQEVHKSSLTAFDDSTIAVNPPPAPGHCYLDFRDLTRKEKKDRRSNLLRFALARGMAFPDAPSHSGRERSNRGITEPELLKRRRSALAMQHEAALLKTESIPVEGGPHHVDALEDLPGQSNRRSI